MELNQYKCQYCKKQYTEDEIKRLEMRIKDSAQNITDVLDMIRDMRAEHNKYK